MVTSEELLQRLSTKYVWVARGKKQLEADKLWQEYVENVTS